MGLTSRAAAGPARTRGARAPRRRCRAGNLMSLRKDLAGDMGLAMPGRAAPLLEPQEKGSECLELFGAEGNELKTMSSSVNIYQMNESRV